MALTSEQWREYTFLASNAWRQEMALPSWNEGGFSMSSPATQALKQFADTHGLSYEIYQGDYYDYAANTLRDQFNLGPRAVNRVFDSLASPNYRERWLQYADPAIYAEDFFSFRENPVRNSGSIFNSIFGGTFNPVNFLNPISGGQALSRQFSQNPGTVIEGVVVGTVRTPEVNYTNLGVQAGLNVAGSVGLGFGIEGVTSAYSNYAASAVQLPTGVQGPVNPGFWASLNSGNLAGAFDNIVSPISGLVHSPNSIFPNKAVATTGDIGLGQLVTTLTNAFGDVGRAVMQALGGNFVQALQTLGIIQGPSRVTPMIGPQGFTNGGSGGGGGSYLSNNGQTQTATIAWIPILLIGGLLLFVLLKRKR